MWYGGKLREAATNAIEFIEFKRGTKRHCALAEDPGVAARETGKPKSHDEHDNKAAQSPSRDIPVLAVRSLNETSDLSIVGTDPERPLSAGAYRRAKIIRCLHHISEGIASPNAQIRIARISYLRLVSLTQVRRMPK